MTEIGRKPFDEFEAGHEIDVLVAEIVMGWILGTERITRPDGGSFNAPLLTDWHDPNYRAYSLPPYSTDIEAAWLVVERVQQSHGMLSVSWSEGNHYYCEEGTDDDPTPVHRCTPVWWCVIYPKQGLAFEGPWSHSAPLAICRAALAAINGRR